jgi:hypothetical protein
MFQHNADSLIRNTFQHTFHIHVHDGECSKKESAKAQDQWQTKHAFKQLIEWQYIVTTFDSLVIIGVAVERSGLPMQNIFKFSIW